MDGLGRFDGLKKRRRPMTFGTIDWRPKWAKLAALAAATPLLLDFLDGCNDKLVELSRYIDPCGTVFANCTPGTFEVRRAEVGDFCVDPACTVPGQCGTGQPLGTITDICP